ncbi:MAG: hypothetical protein CML12_03175 [Puniceicoccaceae bacterium]|nr:hypothetical protein [Puniceicoccaceae bacterium]
MKTLFQSRPVQSQPVQSRPVQSRLPRMSTARLHRLTWAEPSRLCTSIAFLLTTQLSIAFTLVIAPASLSSETTARALNSQLSPRAEALGYIPNQIIVKYKDLSQSPLASNLLKTSIASIAPSSNSAEDRPIKNIRTIVVQTKQSGRQKNYQASFEPLLPPALSALRAQQKAQNSIQSPSLRSLTQAPNPAYALVRIISDEEVVPLGPIIETFRSDPNVEFAVTNDLKKLHEVRFERSDLPDDPFFSLQWGLENDSANGDDIDYLEAWALSRAPDPSKPIIIAIIDSNFESEHPDLKDRLWVNTQEIPGNNIDDDNNGFIDDIHGFNFSSNNGILSGSDTHGSHVAGISIAEGNNEIGVTGVTPNIQFIGLACSAGGIYLDGLAIFTALEYILALKDRGENIVAVNASYGSNGYNAYAKSLIKELSDAGILFCAAAGNDSWNLDIESDIDKDGRMDTGEDLNHNRILDLGEDRDGDGELDLPEDLDGDGHFDRINEDFNQNTILDPNEDLDNDGRLDFGIEDLDGDGYFDQINEDINGDGVHNINYPSSYELPNILSVASIRQERGLALTSNYGFTEVDLAAPGDFIYSTVNIEVVIEVQDITLSNGTSVETQLIENASNISGESLSGLLVECGIGQVDEFPLEVDGNIALIERGTLYFYEKVLNAMNAGATAVIIYNNVEENPDGQRMWSLSAIASTPWIPSFSISRADGQSLLETLPLNATLRPYIESIDPNSNPYGYLSGTSMASPFVTAAVAFAAHNFPDETMIERRDRILNNVVTRSDLSDKVATGGILNLRKIVDTDADDLPDWWEMEHFATLGTSENSDSDNDGYSNREEFLAHTDPMQSSDRPQFKNQIEISDFAWDADGQLNFSFIAYPDYTYQVESSSDLSQLNQVWNTANSYLGDGSPLRVKIDDPDSQSRNFYRLKASPSE